MMKLWLKILICVLVINLLGGAGAFFTMGAIDGWYAELNKPPGVPASWVFGPVWTVLYAMIGLSLALFWHRVASGKEKRTALTWFFVQMVLNLSWTPLFFGAHWLGVSLLVILGMWASILVTLILFSKQDQIAGRLLNPYLVWVSYATYLNAGYWWLNR
ncbi:MAG: tryptophan-rich sensory protein [Verrucomicrobiales bacterium]|nr:tryptophan-rich sensory protein [Verrucomicrobiales bacterium]